MPKNQFEKQREKSAKQSMWSRLLKSQRKPEVAIPAPQTTDWDYANGGYLVNQARTDLIRSHLGWDGQGVNEPRDVAAEQDYQQANDSYANRAVQTSTVSWDDVTFGHYDVQTDFDTGFAEIAIKKEEAIKEKIYAKFLEQVMYTPSQRRICI